MATKELADSWFLKYLIPDPITGQTLLNTVSRMEKGQSTLWSECDSETEDVAFSVAFRDSLSVHLAEHPKSVSILSAASSHSLRHVIDWPTFINLKSSEEFSECDAVGRTGLIWLVFTVHIKGVEALLDSSGGVASITLSDSHGNTALHYAAAEGNTLCVQLLLDRGADPYVKNHFGETPADLVMNHQHKECWALLTEKYPDFETPEDSLLDKMLMSKKGHLAFPGLRIHRPVSEMGLCAEAQILRMLRVEIPSVTKCDPQLLLVPGKKPKTFAHEQQQAGSDGEQLVYSVLQGSLEALHQQLPDWSFALFSGLSILEGETETEMDACLLSFHKESSKSAAMFCEVKTCKERGDVLAYENRRGGKVVKGAAFQLLTQTTSMEKKLKNSSLSWVTKTIALPCFPNETCNPVCGAEEALQGFMDSISEEKTRKIKEYGENPISLAFSQITVHPLFSHDLSEGSRMTEFLRHHLVEKSEVHENFPDLFVLVMVFCKGYLLEKSLDSLDQYTYAFVQRDQEAVLKDSDGGKKPWLILGGSGTGKSFLAWLKLGLLKESGQVTPEKQAVYLVHEACTALQAAFYAHANAREIPEDCYVIMSCPHKEHGQLEVLQEIQKDPNIAWVFIDQFEDSSSDVFESQDMLNAVVQLALVKDGVWIMFNHETCMSVLFKDDLPWEEQCKVQFLGTRLRNAPNIGNCLLQSGSSGWWLASKSIPHLPAACQGDGLDHHQVYIVDYLQDSREVHSNSPSTDVIDMDFVDCVVTLVNEKVDFLDILVVNNTGHKVTAATLSNLYSRMFFRFGIEQIIPPDCGRRQYVRHPSKVPLILRYPFQQCDECASGNKNHQELTSFESEVQERIDNIFSLLDVDKLSEQLQDFQTWLEKQESSLKVSCIKRACIMLLIFTDDASRQLTWRKLTQERSSNLPSNVNPVDYSGMKSIFSEWQTIAQECPYILLIDPMDVNLAEADKKHLLHYLPLQIPEVEPGHPMDTDHVVVKIIKKCMDEGIDSERLLLVDVKTGSKGPGFSRHKVQAALRSSGFRMLTREVEDSLGFEGTSEAAISGKLQCKSQPGKKKQQQKKPPAPKRVKVEISRAPVVVNAALIPCPWCSAKKPHSEFKAFQTTIARMLQTICTSSQPKACLQFLHVWLTELKKDLKYSPDCFQKQIAILLDITEIAFQQDSPNIRSLFLGWNSIRVSASNFIAFVDHSSVGGFECDIVIAPMASMFLVPPGNDDMGNRAKLKAFVLVPREELVEVRKFAEDWALPLTIMDLP
ncbi:unnamed protein product [Notodromas monacha]|uniref:Uncharacterized protein n=1 Tax=Notodromas monacha TaxID=399045 RepID=A0A7R9BJM7_9CRUS|nr:unnamed protein product [Notodromas monacha]CAG0915588.1 unnamed protein product [Notodromas monacha]